MIHAPDVARHDTAPWEQATRCIASAGVKLGELRKTVTDHPGRGRRCGVAQRNPAPNASCAGDSSNTLPAPAHRPDPIHGPQIAVALLLIGTGAEILIFFSQGMTRRIKCSRRKHTLCSSMDLRNIVCCIRCKHLWIFREPIPENP